jgi:hypothetical protein
LPVRARSRERKRKKEEGEKEEQRKGNRPEGGRVIEMARVPNDNVRLETGE